MANFPFVIGDALQIGTATITATGNAVVLPTGTQVGSTAVATSTEVATGGGPKITNLQVIDNSFQVLDDTAVDITGGYIKITGTNFTSGCIVYIGLVPATATSFVSATEVRAQLAATAAGTYPVYLVNPDGGVAIRVPGVTFSASPSWQTASALSEQYDGAPLTLALVASDATSYTLVSGALPPGLSLNTSTGAITGTITGVTVDTVYTFTVRATDAQNQDSPRTFTVNVAVSDTYFRLTTLLLSGSALSANTVIRDSSTNNFNLTVFGDARASNFTPYGTGWSVYFDGTGDYLSLGNNNPLPATGDFTFECWIYVPSLPGVQSAIIANQNQSNRYMLWLTSTGGLTIQVGASFSRSTGNNVIAANRWYHIATTRTGTTHNLFVDGIAATLTTSGGSPASIDNTEFFIGINYNSSYAFTGYISNFRVVTSILYTSTFTPSTGSLTAITNTSLLTCHANRFLDGSTNNFAITRNGDAKIVSFNPFNITNTGVNGSMYFDGTGDYVQAANSTNLDVGTGDFSIEAWCYKTNTSTATDWRVMGGSASSSGFFGDGGTTSSRGFGIGRSGVAWDVTSNVQAPIYEWFHICYTRKSGAVRIFLNGKLIAYAAGNTNNYGLNAGTLQIVAEQGGNLLTGYLTDFRLFKTVPASYDTAITTINNQVFTPPTQPLTAIANTQLLTLQYDQPHNNHTFLDSSSNQFLITRSGNATQGTFSPFSPAGYSYYLDGGDQFSSPSTANLNLNLYNNWTVEGWFYRQGPFGVNDNALSLGTKRSAVWWSFYVGTAGGGVAVGFGTGAWAFVTAPTGPSSGINLNQWHHVAFVRNGASTMLIFIDGILQYTNTSYNFGSATQGGTLYIGSYVNDADNVGAYYNGYISNLRIVNGQSLYTANFTPSTSSLTTTSQGAIASNVAILTAQTNRFIDVSLSARALTMSGDARVVAFSPFAPTAVYSPAVHGGSAYFDGTGDYLTVPHDPAVVLNNEDWTIEFWVYPTVDARADLICKGNGASYVPYQVILLPSGQINFNASNNGSNHAILLYSNTGDYRLFQWNHIAVTKSGSTIRIFCQGALVATGSYSGGAMTNSLPLGIGAGSDGAQRLTGYMSHVRIIKGTALYTSAFTVPTAPPSPTTNTSLLLNCTDAAILDSTGRNTIETVGDAKTSSVVTKFTGGSMYFDGTGDYVKITPNYLTGIGTADFTIEGWWYFLDFTTRTVYFQRFWSFGTGLANHVTLNIDNSGYPVYRNNDSPLITSSAALSLSTWTHVALVRYNGTTRIYINGTDRGNTATNNDLSSRATNIFYIGSESDGAGGYFYGYVSDFRITRYARYTGNFTAPTAPARLK